MKALLLEKGKATVHYTDVEKPKPQKDEILVRIKAAALNHRDVYITQGLYPGIVYPVILGSDGVGVVESVGEDVAADWIDKAVIINPGIGWTNDPLVQPKNYSILGMPTNGCLAEYIVVKADRIQPKPEHLSYEEAAALPLAGLTAYRALFTKANCCSQDQVLISGIGGGVALMAFQFACATGAKVFVTSGSDTKIQKAIALGAQGGVSYKEEGWHKTLLELSGKGFDVIIDSAGGEGFSKFLDLANMGGRIAFYGGTRGNFKVNPQKMFWKQISMFGSTMGNDQEFNEMIQFVNINKIKPVVEKCWKLSEGAMAFDYMNQAKQFGKIVLTP